MSAAVPIGRRRKGGVLCSAALLAVVPSAAAGPALGVSGQAPDYSCSPPTRERLGLGEFFVDVDVRVCTGVEEAGAGTRLLARTEAVLAASRPVPPNDAVSVRLTTRLDQPTGGAAAERCDRSAAVQRGGWRRLRVRCELDPPTPAAPPGRYRASGWVEWATSVGIAGTVPAGAPAAAPSRVVTVAARPADPIPSTPASTTAVGPSSAAAAPPAGSSAASDSDPADPAGPAGPPAALDRLAPWLVAALLAAAAAAAAHRRSVGRRRSRSWGAGRPELSR